MDNITTVPTTDYQIIAQQKANEEKDAVYVVAKDGSYLYLSFKDDFDWTDVLFVAKPE